MNSCRFNNDEIFLQLGIYFRLSSLLQKLLVTLILRRILRKTQSSGKKCCQCKGYKLFILLHYLQFLISASVHVLPLQKDIHRVSC